MKFFKYDTSSEFARPCLRSWLVIFVCGFLTACIIALGLCLLLSSRNLLSRYLLRLILSLNNYSLSLPTGIHQLLLILFCKGF